MIIVVRAMHPLTPGRRRRCRRHHRRAAAAAGAVAASATVVVFPASVIFGFDHIGARLDNFDGSQLIPKIKLVVYLLKGEKEGKCSEGRREQGPKRPTVHPHAFQVDD